VQLSNIPKQAEFEHFKLHHTQVEGSFVYPKPDRHVAAQVKLLSIKNSAASQEVHCVGKEPKQVRHIKLHSLATNINSLKTHLDPPFELLLLMVKLMSVPLWLCVKDSLI
jgi:hypothetical protein